jgi:hypothetical protein
VAGLVVGIEMALGLVITPAVSGTNGDVHAGSLRTLMRVYGKAMPLLYAVTSILFGIATVGIHRIGKGGYRLALGSSLLVFAALILMLVYPMPVDSGTAPEELRIWGFLHFVRVVILAAALMLFVAACFASA